MEELSILLNPARMRSRGPFMDPPAVFHPKILLGPGAFLTNPKFVSSRNITHVVNVGEVDSCPRWVQKALGPRYTHIPCQDTATEQIFTKYPVFERTMNEYLAQKGCRCVYVHCQAGMNRSATLLVGYMVKEFKIPLPTVVLHGIRQRPCMLMNPFFNRQLLDFAKKHTKE